MYPMTNIKEEPSIDVDRHLGFKKSILRWCPAHAHFQNVLYLIHRCIKDKDNDQRANKAEIKTQILT